MGITAPDSQWAQHVQVRTLSGWTQTRRGSFHHATAFGIS